MWNQVALQQQALSAIQFRMCKTDDQFLRWWSVISVAVLLVISMQWEWKTYFWTEWFGSVEMFIFYLLDVEKQWQSVWLRDATSLTYNNVLISNTVPNLRNSITFIELMIHRPWILSWVWFFQKQLHQLLLRRHDFF